MKIWWFKQLKHIVSRIAECDELRKVGDDWWRFKRWVMVFNRKRKRIFSSLIFVFDESMSAFVPRQVFLMFYFFTHPDSEQLRQVGYPTCHSSSKNQSLWELNSRLWWTE